MAKLYGNLCIIYGIRVELEKAEEMCRKAIGLQEALGSKEGMAIDYSNLGNVYQRRGEPEKADEMRRKALALFREIGATYRVKQIQALLDTLPRNDRETRRAGGK